MSKLENGCRYTIYTLKTPLPVAYRYCNFYIINLSGYHIHKFYKKKNAIFKFHTACLSEITLS